MNLTNLNSSHSYSSTLTLMKLSLLREAVKLLVARNVLIIRRGKGTYIANHPGEIPDPLRFAYSPDQLQLGFDLLEIRHNLEPWVARVTAE